MEKGTKIIEFPRKFGSALFSPDGKTIASTNAFDDQAIVRTWNGEDGEFKGSLPVPVGTYGGGFNAAFSADGKKLAVGSIGYAFLWDLQSAAPSAAFKMNSQVVWVGFGPHEKHLIAAEIGDVHVWDLANGTELAFLQEAHSQRVQGVSLSPDNSLLVSWGEDRKAKAWDIASGTERTLEKLTDINVGDAGYSADGKRFSIRNGNTVSVWDTSNGKNLLAADLEADCGEVEAVSPDWQLVACETSDRNLAVWDVLGGKALKILTGEEGMSLNGNHIQFSPDGKYLAADYSGFIDGEFAFRIYLFGVR
ncbi:MAG: hypothetical protein WBM17_02565 [Anaerolineales bacterium]